MALRETMEVELVEKEFAEVELIEKEFTEVELSVIDLIPRRRNIYEFDDVNIDDAENDDILVREGEYWVNKPISTIITDIVHNEEPSFISGKKFQTAQAYLTGSLEVFLNGIKEKFITQISDTQFELPIYDPSYDDVEISYIKK